MAAFGSDRWLEVLGPVALGAAGVAGVAGGGWHARRTRTRRVVRVAADRGLPVLHALVADTARQLGVPVPGQVWVTGGCTVRTEAGYRGRTRLVVGAAPLLVLPPAELRAVVARSLALVHAGQPAGWQADEAMTRVASGWTAAAALLHLAVVEQRFAQYRTACVEPLAGAGMLPADLYAGWRQRHRDGIERAVYTAGFDLDQLDEPADTPLRERLARLTPDVGHLPLFPTDRK